MERRLVEFRGINKNSKSWSFGNLMIDNDGNCEIWQVESFEDQRFLTWEVDSKTVGQFTGLTDKNGIRIFEGDIVRILYTDWASKSEDDSRALMEYLEDISNIGSVIFENCQFKIKLKGGFGSIFHGEHGFIEVIGNIHQTPELLTA